MASMHTERAPSSSSSSSSSFTPQLTYDVFLSFRGEDTRYGFTSHLYTALDQKGIYTFMDDEKLERGKSISPELMKAIKESRLAIIILSENYASSTWSEAEVIQDIVKVTFDKLNDTSSVDTKGLVGINSQVEQLKSYLAIGSEDVRIIGIWGTGGMGKTTLARVVYDMVSNQFEACGFITDVRVNSKKYGLPWLQKQLLKKLLKCKDIDVEDVNSGVLMLKKRLRHKKILVVLDDVNQPKQLDKLAGEHDWFGLGSRVIITTRDKHLLVTHGANEIYEVKTLNNDEALQLFSLKAFKKDQPDIDYVELSQAFVHYSQGLPLALEILGSFFINRCVREWKSELDRLRKFPKREIFDVL
ncbi:TMV resistance protein N-like [Quercus lobata]|uniref:TMV resistance protein N-like n=1 Tax=Quercus lobata TaxID=97700 RepID=UPI00124760F9|nr:TMV resistance protein N-like [Quercus lobata]